MSRIKKVLVKTFIVLGIIIIGLGCGSENIYTEVEIDASEDQVWAILSDLEAYKEWNPFMQEALGELVVGERLHMRLHNESLTLDPFEPTILQVIPGKEINWLGRVANIPRLFDGHHHLVIEPQPNGGVKFIQYEQFNGIIVSLTKLFQKQLFVDTEQGFIKMNHALKSKAEGLSGDHKKEESVIANPPSNGRILSLFRV